LADHKCSDKLLTASSRKIDKEGIYWHFLWTVSENGSEMHTPHLLVLNPDTSLHVGSFRPAISLTEDLPQGVDADILLLGCGDARHILYTSYFEEGLPDRKLDITACDTDEHLIGEISPALELLLVV
jgi:hypothetical protein